MKIKSFSFGKFDVKQTGMLILIAAIGVIFAFFGTIISFLVDLSWFREVGYTDTFLKMVFSKLIVGAPIFVFFYIFLTIYLKLIKKKYYDTMDIIPDPEVDKRSGKMKNIAVAIVSILFAFSISNIFWMDILKFINSTVFGITDPLYNRDISFYVFKLPLVNNLFALALNALISLVIITAVYFAVLIGQDPPARDEHSMHDDNIRDMYPEMRNKESMNKLLEMGLSIIIKIGVVFFLVLALRNVLSTYELLYSARGAIYGAGYTDVKVTLWVYRIKAVVSVAIAGVLLFGSKKGDSKKLVLGGISALVIVTLLGAGAEIATQSLIVAPDELSKERPYIQNTIKYTNLAYGIDDVEIRDFEVDQNLTVDDIINNKETITNISLNDYRPTKEAFNQLQGLRGYYSFHDVDIDRYVIDGKITQVFLSIREIDKEKLEANARTWINTKLKYTHGYGATVAPVNQLNPSGQPNMILKNVPVSTNAEALKLSKPQVYFGELTNDYVIVNTNEMEFDYPKGDSNEMTKYDGQGGIELGLFNRALFAARERDLKILISGGINSDSKILINRNIKSRVQKVAPFIKFDEDPYAVIADGRVHYIIDGYTTTNAYPYSEPFSEESNVNYVRNSVKAVVDAYDGTMDFYISDESDPIIKTYSKIFPGLFKAMDQMPQFVREHIRYPQFLFDIQAQMYATYHMSNPDVFYNREDKWDIPVEAYEGETVPMESLYFTFKLPKEEKAEFVLSIPYTPKQKQNMTAFLVGRNDGEAYGDLVLYSFPKDKSIIGPQQMEARFSNNDMISKDLSLWDTSGSQVLRGHILTIPIKSSILYVEPLYIRAASENAIPEVKRIIVGYNDKVVMEETLDKALEKIFGKPEDSGEVLAGSVVDDEGNPVDIIDENGPDALPSGTQSELSTIAYANKLYEEAQEALKKGSLSEYESKINELGEVLKQLS
ncbi:UPF0182 family membrane protein [Proteocatella sphenisci]|uniref:UPF0182 family membrane protein n=1 Tax=Proteocatella sphenisci TaxID=181070 RepID=UPI0004B10327|nr:UPF0182 family protein [Proteocatella sphenisci]